MYITLSEIDDQFTLMNKTGYSKPVHWDNPEGWEGVGVGGRLKRGGYIHIWLTHIVWQKPT